MTCPVSEHLSFPSGWTTRRRPGPRRIAARAGESSVAVVIFVYYVGKKNVEFSFFLTPSSVMGQRRAAPTPPLCQFHCPLLLLLFFFPLLFLLLSHQSLPLFRHGLHVEDILRLDGRAGVHHLRHRGSPRPRRCGLDADGDGGGDGEDRLFVLLAARPPRGRCLLRPLLGGTTPLFGHDAVSVWWLNFLLCCISGNYRTDAASPPRVSSRSRDTFSRGPFSRCVRRFYVLFASLFPLEGWQT